MRKFSRKQLWRKINGGEAEAFDTSKDVITTIDEEKQL